MAVNFTIPTVNIPVGEGSFDVRGVNSEDVVFLTTHYLEDIKQAVTDFGVSNKAGRVKATELAMDLAKGFPLMAAEIISRCADQPDEIETYRRLSFAKQIVALKAIFDLSVENGADLKKVAGFVASLLEAKGFRLGPLSKELQSIIGASASTSPT